MMTTLDRFSKKRWSPTRIAIHDMQPGATLPFKPAEYYNVKSAIERLNDAYDGEKEWSYKSFSVNGETKHTTVRRIK